MAALFKASLLFILDVLIPYRAIELFNETVIKCPFQPVLDLRFV